MSDQPKSEIRRGEPTGEWTVEDQERYLRIVDSSGRVICDTHQVFAHIFKSVADAHNAAIDEAVDAAEQEILLLRQQLAAEREKVTLATQMVQIESKRANEAEQKMQTLVDALKNVLFDLGDNWSVVTEKNRRAADDALAKVGK